MQLRSFVVIPYVAFCLVLVSSLFAQDLGPHIKKIKEGIYVENPAETSSNCGIILTSEGVILIDSGTTPVDSRLVLAAVKKLTPLPIRFLIDTENHPDHTTGHWLFSPPAIIVAYEGAGEAMKKNYEPDRNETLMKQSPAMREAFEGYRMVAPQLEYHDKMTLHLGERTLELIHMASTHSETDTAVWLPQERVLFAASAAIPGQINNLRPLVSIPSIFAAIKMLRSLNPEVVVAGHGIVGTTKIFDDSERYYNLLLERVGTMMREGKTLDQIKKELRMPEYESWANQERMPSNAEAAYRALKAN
jgi:cyclase